MPKEDCREQADSDMPLRAGFVISEVTDSYTTAKVECRGTDDNQSGLAPDRISNEELVIYTTCKVKERESRGTDD